MPDDINGNPGAFHVIGNSTGSCVPLTRRELVQRILAGVGASLVWPFATVSHPIHKHLADAATLSQADAKVAAADWTPIFLDSRQNETLILLSEAVVPGSAKAQANRFVDLLLSVDSPENQREFLSSLSAIDAESMKRHGHPFRDLTAVQQNEILAVASAVQAGDKKEKIDLSSPDLPAEETSKRPLQNLHDHFENLKGWIAGAYYSSEPGMTELGWNGNYYFKTFPGCPHPEGHR